MSSPLQHESRWPHRWAVLLCCATFPLIWVGGLVTTYDAGMAVPDWPSTYGYNLLLYPWTTWVFGPWDLFIEHGHRLLGAAVGVLTIALAVASWTADRRPGMRWGSLLALVLVIVQGSLGGARVLLDDRVLAMLHGCVGPMFFGLCVSLAVYSSAYWQRTESPELHPRAGRLQRLAFLTAALAYVQLAIGAQLRHIPAMASAASFRWIVIFHLFLAAVLCFHILLLAFATRQQPRLPLLHRPALGLLLLVTAQVGLGLATWVVKYGVPSILAEWPPLAGYTVQAKGLSQAMLVTAHVAMGSLLIAASVMITVRSFRLVRSQTVALGSGALIAGVAA